VNAAFGGSRDTAQSLRRDRRRAGADGDARGLTRWSPPPAGGPGRRDAGRGHGAARAGTARIEDVEREVRVLQEGGGRPTTRPTRMASRPARLRRGAR